MADKTIGQIYADVWKSFIAEMDRHAALMADVHVTERQGDVNRDYCVFDDDDLDFFKEIDEKGKKIFDRLVHYAEQAFAPPGGRLKIEDSKLHGKFIGAFADRSRDVNYQTFKQKAMKGWRKFNPAKVWAELETRYGGNNGLELGYRQAAKEIISFLGIKPGQPVKVKMGNVVLDVSIRSERRFRGNMELAFGSQDEVMKGLNNLATIAEWAEDDLTAGRLCRFAQEIWHNRPLITRERIQVSEIITVITYFNRYEFRIAPTFAQKLQEFIATYGNLIKSASRHRE